MTVPEYFPRVEQILDLQDFIIMDNLAVQQGLPIPVMMEQAGHHLATIAVNFADFPTTVNIGVGPGNNGGGGLVAARRLHAWGYDVSLHFIDQEKNPCADLISYLRSNGVKTSTNWDAEIQIDAYLGFSQRLPLSSEFTRAVKFMNNSNGQRIVLDIPTGIGSNTVINADAIVCLAAPKKVLLHGDNKCPIYIADLGIPNSVYQSLGLPDGPPFHKGPLLKWNLNETIK